MIISVASGKGGTGKTTVAVNLALSIDHVHFLDADVEEPNAYLFLKPSIKEKARVSVPIPEIDETRCTFCGKCQEVCAYHAIAVLQKKEKAPGSVLVFAHLCHGCGACALLCPEGAIREVGKEIGTIERGVKDAMLFASGCLDVGQAMSPPVIRRLKEYKDLSRTVIIDAPPGTSCPVISAVKGSDFCILVTEPTPFGLHDLMLAVEVLRVLSVPFGVVINRADIGDDKLEAYCRQEGIPVLMRIPFDRRIAELYAEGIPLIQEKKEYKDRFAAMFDFIKRELKK